MTLPRVSVIMPVRNEEAFIERSLGAVLKQDYPADRLEILVADGMSDDATLERIQAIGDSRVRVIPNPERIQAAGLNAAIQQATGEIIVRVDGHTVIAPDYVRQCVEALETSGADNAGGAMDPVGTTPMGKTIAVAGKSRFAVPSAFHVSQTAQYTDTVYLGAWRREVFDKVGLFNPSVNINEDYELNYRIRKAGGRIYFTPAIQSQYFGRQTLQALAKQYFRYGKVKTETLRQHPGSLKLRHLVAPLFVAWLVLGGVIALFSSAARWIWLAGILLYAAANLFFSLQTARASDRGIMWRLPVVFFTIHAAWGAGFWVGMVGGLTGKRG